MHGRTVSDSTLNSPQRPPVPTKPTRNENSRPGLPPKPSTESIQIRSNLSDQGKWLAHTPTETIRTNTVLQPSVVANKRVHRPSESDLKKSDRYILTHQDMAPGDRWSSSPIHWARMYDCKKLS